ncbi:LacI family DNA-binding transcriptional regulator [Alloscardovia venturai]|uniref:LacI family DNA-binding transcriptional regulator n=1 Tax=Alloscardovia venturai TaxID=1769421 RepID=A0ABW2Y701_9BIFI
MATLKEISLKAGVSVSTVSLVLNNRDAGRVKAHIAERVRKVAQDLGYHPNLMARGLRTNHTRILGFLSEEVATTPYAGGMILGAQEAARKNGYVLITVSTDGENSEDAEIAVLERYGVDGFFYAKMSNRFTTVPSRLSNYPVVLLDAVDSHNTVTSITPNELLIGYDATKKLIDAGCTRIAYIGCSEPMLAQGKRLEGYKKALTEAKLPIDENLIINVFNNGPALHAVEKLMCTYNPDGYFCFNDARAWYVYESAARSGLTIGRDISVVGVDNHRVLAETLSPQLTTVELPHYEMGYWAACKLISMIEDCDTSKFALPSTRSPLPSLANNGTVTIHCALIDKESVQ